MNSTVRNILLYLNKPGEYEPIASEEQKKLIADKLGFLDDQKRNNINEKISKIREVLSGEDYLNNNNISFYDEKILPLWNSSFGQREFGEVDALRFKKNIILYGPPGTSKTYKAQKLAESLVVQALLKVKKNKNVIESYFKGEGEIKTNIHRLQLHQNFNYEDFIGGYHLVNGNIQFKEGYFLRLCNRINIDNKKAENTAKQEASRNSDQAGHDEDSSKKAINEAISKAKENRIPHVLILDEINRVDLSRLFGEAFSLIEGDYRDKKYIELPFLIKNEFWPYKDFHAVVLVPSNLYIIGTMNEIDFSLERVDFALRRRFMWFNYSFNEKILINIIYNKAQSALNEINEYAKDAKSLNKEISDSPNLGKQYQIGHTFFAEIFDIVNQEKTKLDKSDLVEGSKYRKRLWEFSLKPMIEAMLGLNYGDQSSITDFKNIFVKE